MNQVSLEYLILSEAYSWVDFIVWTADITVDPVYSERGYSEYPVIANGFLRTDR
jgi:hypothetical protein